MAFLKNDYDYIITGAGCAGLSLLCRMIGHSFFEDKKILVVDQSSKNTNDKTWCFWEKESGFFESIVHHRWSKFDFFSNNFSRQFNFAPYKYKMIRSIDFYDHVLDIAKQKNNIHFQVSDIEKIGTENGSAFAIVDGKKITAALIFNSIFFNKKNLGRYNLLQHFKGWMIETSQNVFDKDKATFMDFKTNQGNGAAFFYVLPVEDNKALVEYTLFSKAVLNDVIYEEALKNYIEQNLKIEKYHVVEKEFGIIPMTDHHFSNGTESIVNIGTAGGQTKASSGFTFQFIQKNVERLIDAIVHNKDLHFTNSFFEKRFNLYDHVLLNILHHHKMEASEIFSKLFENNPVEVVLSFLDNESSFVSELKIMQSMPAKIFLPTALKEMFHF